MTAEEFLKSKDYNITDDGELYDGLLTNNVIKDMVEFANLQVVAALNKVTVNKDLNSRYKMPKK